MSADQNVVAVAGSTATLNCTTTTSTTTTSNTPTRWHYTGVGHKTPVSIFNGRAMNDDYFPRHGVQCVRVVRDTFRCQLTITDLRLGDAGTFRCSRLMSSATISIFHLAVLGTRLRHSSFLFLRRRSYGSRWHHVFGLSVRRVRACVRKQRHFNRLAVNF